jgi:hypothetical protein
VGSPTKHAKGAGKNGNVPPEETRWKPGQSGNPTGHPKGYYPISAAEADVLSWPLEEVVKPLLEEGLNAMIPEDYRRRLKPAHLVALARLRAASDSENRSGVASAEHLADRTEGKVKATLELEGNSLAGLVAALAKGASR